jgi:hypothetical protein
LVPAPAKRPVNLQRDLIMRKKKAVISGALETVKTVAGAAAGAAASAATGVVAATVANALSEGGKKLEQSTPQLQKAAAETVAKPLTRHRTSPAKRTVTRTAAARKASPKKTSAKVSTKKRSARGHRSRRSA